MVIRIHANIRNCVLGYQRFNIRHWPGVLAKVSLGRVCDHVFSQQVSSQFQECAIARAPSFSRTSITKPNAGSWLKVVGQGRLVPVGSAPITD
jgi:hypothetical protein